MSQWWNIDFDGIASNPLCQQASLYVNGKEFKGELIVPTGKSSIGNTFSGCKGITSVNIPNSVTTIAYGAFYKCYDLVTVIISNSVQTIGGRTFYECEKLTNISLPTNITEINYETFSGCKSLSEATIPDGVTNIGTRAFYNCSSLSSIIIPSSVEEIGQEAFYGCRGLTSIICKGNNPPQVDSDAFYYFSTDYNNEVFSDAILRVPKGALNAYESTYPWNNFKKIIEE